jgi:hypothetical protein
LSSEEPLAAGKTLVAKGCCLSARMHYPRLSMTVLDKSGESVARRRD